MGTVLSWGTGCCTRPGCEHPTQHKSGVCMHCRTHTCIACGKVYTLQEHMVKRVETKLCSRCKKIKKWIKEAGYG